MSEESTLKRWRAEWPLLLGVVLGCYFLWIRGGSFVVLEHPAGMGWEAYYQFARSIALGADPGPSNVTKPLYPWVLSVLGERLGYTPAGTYISSMGMAGVVVASGLGARLLAGRWAGGLAAMSVAFVDTFAQASRWSNLYPLLAALTGLALVSGLAFHSRQKLRYAFLAGLLGALAWATDWRGFVVLPGAVLLVLLGIRSGKKGALAVLLLALGIGLGPVVEHTISSRVDQPWTMQLEGERFARVQDMMEKRPELGAACEGAVSQEMPRPGWIFTPCARALLTYNLELSWTLLPFDLRLFLWMLPLCLLPGRRGWMDSLTSGVVFATGVLLLGGVATWAVLPDRYVVHFAVPLCMVVPVGLVRGLSFLPKKIPERLRRAAPVLACVLAAVLLVRASARQRVSPPTSQPAFPPLMEDSRVLLGEDDVMMDCAGGSVALAWLPRLLHTRPTNGSPMDGQACQAWVQRPEQSTGDTWLLHGGQTNRPGELILVDPESVEGWTLYKRYGQGKSVIALWRWDGA
jgi:hypothetical protein